MESGDWRAQLPADSRQRIANKILDTLKRHLPFSTHEGLQELKGIAERFEDKTYTAATSQSDYLRKISLKMLTMETRAQNPMPDAYIQSDSTANNQSSNRGSIQVNGGPLRVEAVLYASMDSGDWRPQLQVDSRQRIVNKILDTLKRHLPFSGDEGLQELKGIAESFEDKVYTAATSQSDYLRKISLKMLSMEHGPQNPTPDAYIQSYSTANSLNL